MPDPFKTSKKLIEKDSISTQKITVSMDNVLNRVILIITVLTFLGLLATFFLYQRKMGSALVILALLITMFLARFLMKRGHIRQASICAVSGVWLIFFIFVLLGGGLDNINIIFFISTTVWAGLLLGERATITVAGISIVAGLGLALMAMFGYLPSRYFMSSPLADWAQLVLALVLTAGTLNIALRERSNALNIARRQLADRLEAEKALLESEKTYRLLTEKMTDIVWIADMNLRTVYVTPSVQTVLGFTQEERMQQTVDQQFTPESLSIGMEALAKELALEKKQQGDPGRTVTLVLEYYHKDGSTRWMETVMNSLRDDRGVLTGLHGVSRDITESKRTEEALRESEEKFSRIFRMSPDTMLISRLSDGVYIDVNDEFTRRMGYTREEAIGKSTIEMGLWVDLSERHRLLENLRTKGEIQNEVYRFRHKDGTTKTGEVSARIVTIGGENYLLAMIRDISEKLETQRALRESEERFRSAVERSLIGIAIIDDAFRYIYVNEEFCQMAGFEKQEILGKDFTFLLTEESKSFMAERLRRRQQGEDVPAQYEFSFIRKNGEKCIGEVRSAAYLDSSGKVKVIIQVIDITERRQAENALKESEANYRHLFENVPAAIYRVDFRSGKFVKMNDVFRRYSGYSDEEITALSVYDVLSEKSKKLFLERLEKMARGEEVSDAVEYEVIDKTGKQWYLQLNNKMIYDEEGCVIASDVVAHDITEQKKVEEALRMSEERYRTIFENTATANVIIAEDSTIVMANNDFAAWSGYTKQELERKMSWTGFIHQDDLEKIKGYDKRRWVDPGSVPSSYEIRSINRKGEVRNLLLSVAVIPGAKEKIVSLMDITGKKQLETQIIQAQKMESVGRLAGGVAHDFNNMLSVILGNTEMALRKVKSSEPIYTSLQDIMSAGQRSAALTRQLLAFARKQTVTPKVLDLNDTVSGMLKMLQRLIGENISLGWQPGHNLWKVRIDPSQVDQLLANLTVNARDAIKTTGKIIIETSNITCDEAFCAGRPENAPGEYALLAVSDNGYGMEKETLANIFEPFFTTKKDGQGTGLGLATVYGIVKQNGGFINVYSEPEYGTTFKVYLPRHLDENLGKTDDKQETDVQGGNETILLVEDEESVLMLGRDILKMLGYKVLTANTANQALRMVREYDGNIDLLLTDVVMPDMNGKELSNQIITVKPGLKCMFMSGYTADVIARQGVLDEGIQFISKPFSIKDLGVKVREVLS